MHSRDETTVGVVSIPPYQYIHVLDTNTNITKIKTGPQRYTRNESEKVIAGPLPMMNVPPRTYVIVENPHIRSEDGAAVMDEYGQVKLRHGDLEVRMADEWGSPFPLYPGEIMSHGVTKLRVVDKNSALRLRAIRDFTEVGTDDEQISRQAGDEWLFKGPGTYIPRIEVEVLELQQAVVIKHSQALKLKARRLTKDHEGEVRKAGEEWLVRDSGAYLPSVDEEMVGMVDAVVLTDKTALHLTAIKTFEDVYGHTRKAGEDWLVTVTMTDSHIVDVYEQAVTTVHLITLSNRNFAVVLNPYIDGVQRLGMKQLRKGEASFFLLPGEQLEAGIQDVHVLAEDEALLLQAVEEFQEAADPEPDYNGAPATVLRRPGDRWMVYGPREYIPPVELAIIEKRKAIPLDVNEGIYVRNTKTGQVRAVIGTTYMLKPTEELWEKELPDEVEQLLQKQALGINYLAPAHYPQSIIPGMPVGAPKGNQKARDRTRVVDFRVAENAAVQVYDYKKREARVVFGPDMVMLMPDEQFSVMRLSGDKPKRPNVITSLCLSLGPDFMTDILTVETCDHARLRLTLSYNWHFVRDSSNTSKIFSVRDFTGDACKTIASKIRGSVALETFQNFHTHSARIIRTAVLGIDASGKVRDALVFAANDLAVTNVDIQNVEPVEEETRASLQKSVQMAIEITTNSQEARARHDAYREEEEAKGLLEQQRLRNSATAEESRKTLLLLQAETSSIETAGQAKGEAQARAEAARIDAEAAVNQAQLRTKAMTIEANAQMDTERQQAQAEFEHTQRMNQLEIEKSQKLAAIEQDKFRNVVEALGRDTITAIARAGPEMQAQLLQGLGLQGYMITDGKTPINLFNTARGMISVDGMGGSAEAK